MTEIRGLSLAYAAPERILNWRKVLNVDDKRVILSWDIYSVGIIHIVSANDGQNGKRVDLIGQPHE